MGLRNGPMKTFSFRAVCKAMMFSLAIGFGLLAVTAAVFIWLGSNWFIVPKRRPLEPRHHQVLANPSEYGMELEPIEIETEDGIVLQSYLATLAGSPGTAEKTREMSRRLAARGISVEKEPTGTVYLLHGRGGRKEDLLWVAKRLVAANLRCVVYDARAHGKSGGEYCTFGKKEIGDFASVIDHYESMFIRRGERPGPVFAFGNSLGAAVVLQSLPVENRISAAVAVAPFANLEEIVVRSARYKIHENVPSALVYTAMQLGGFRAGFNPLFTDPIHQVGQSQTPLFLVHGTNDLLIPIEHSRRISQVAPSGVAKLREIPDAHHYDVLAEGGDDLYEEIILFYLSAKNRSPESISSSELHEEAKG